MQNDANPFSNAQERYTNSNVRNIKRSIEKSSDRKDARATMVSELLESKFREIAYNSHLLNMKRPTTNNRYQTYEEDEINNDDNLKRDKNLISFYKSINQRATVTPGRVSKLACSPLKRKSPQSSMPGMKNDYSNEEFNENILHINFNDKKMKDSKANALTSLKKLLTKFKSTTSEKYNQMLSESNQNKTPIFGQVLSNLQNSRIMVIFTSKQFRKKSCF